MALPETRSEQLARALEDDICAGRALPGMRLDEQVLAQRFGTSRTPVREALKMLAAQGFVEIRPRQGAVVVGLDVRQVLELFEIMAVLEGLCARLAARRMTPAERADLMAVHGECQRLAAAGDPDVYYAMNTRFHEVIYAGSHNRQLEEETRRVRNRLSPYRRNQLHQLGRVAKSVQEHDDVVRALLEGDPDRAENLMRRHIGIQGDGLSDFVSNMSTPQAVSSPPPALAGTLGRPTIVR
ncbi:MULTISPECIES: GntR family transcriptional regulator [Nitrospirillum]|uniref:GntR family transcriptional regulator n=1 Tax=Nitrospirillum amazonense TaxID=28077 RepID=A0A560G3S5_9PROT|nr:GntR family transcriptional regulator [Nitrospirillum amazonense]MEC4594761.1 GntR family transcriptional regulator [Nitrospirillum amazonense]TWB28472.1 GntR family transcriptional regulator [Nitrospirillum amazonense]